MERTSEKKYSFFRYIYGPTILTLSKLWIILACGTNDNVAYVHMGRLGDNVKYGVRHVISNQGRSKFLSKALHHFFTIARARLKAAHHQPRLNQRDANPFGTYFASQAFSQCMYGKLGSPIYRAERRYVPPDNRADNDNVGCRFGECILLDTHHFPCGPFAEERGRQSHLS